MHPVLTLDSHGEQLGEHHLLSKTGFYDGSYHLPCIVRDPRPSAEISRGTVVTQYSEAVDVLPTICEIFGLPVPPAVDGRSLVGTYGAVDFLPLRSLILRAKPRVVVRTVSPRQADVLGHSPAVYGHSCRFCKGRWTSPNGRVRHTLSLTSAAMQSGSD